jgi:hypothetical protein
MKPFLWLPIAFTARKPYVGYYNRVYKHVRVGASSARDFQGQSLHPILV